MAQPEGRKGIPCQANIWGGHARTKSCGSCGSSPKITIAVLTMCLKRLNRSLIVRSLHGVPNYKIHFNFIPVLPLFFNPIGHRGMMWYPAAIYFEFNFAFHL